jgi:hypothetical protein
MARDFYTLPPGPLPGGGHFTASKSTHVPATLPALPRIVVDRVAVFVVQVRRVHQLAVDVELELTGGVVADARARAVDGPLLRCPSAPVVPDAAERPTRQGRRAPDRRGMSQRPGWATWPGVCCGRPKPLVGRRGQGCPRGTGCRRSRWEANPAAGRRGPRGSARIVVPQRAAWTTAAAGWRFAACVAVLMVTPAHLPFAQAGANGIDATTHDSPVSRSRLPSGRGRESLKRRDGPLGCRYLGGSAHRRRRRSWP